MKSLTKTRLKQSDSDSDFNHLKNVKKTPHTTDVYRSFTLNTYLYEMYAFFVADLN